MHKGNASVGLFLAWGSWGVVVCEEGGSWTEGVDGGVWRGWCLKVRVFKGDGPVNSKWKLRRLLVFQQAPRISQYRSTKSHPTNKRYCYPPSNPSRILTAIPPTEPQTQTPNLLPEKQA